MSKKPRAKSKEVTRPPSTSSERPSWMHWKEFEVSPKEKLVVEYGLVGNHLWMSAVLWEIVKDKWSKVGAVPIETVKKHDARLGCLVDFFGLAKRDGKVWDDLVRELNLNKGTQ